MTPIVGGGGVGGAFTGGGGDFTGGAFTGGGGAGAVAGDGGGSASAGEGAGSGRLHAARATKAVPIINVRIASRIAERETNRKGMKGSTAMYPLVVGDPLDIQQARLGDAPMIADMSRRLVEHGLTWRWTPIAIRRCIRNAETETIVIRAKSAQPIGFAIMRYGEEEAHLILIAVSPGARRRGIGRTLLEYLEKMARVAGIRRIVVEVRDSNYAARTFYADAGYGVAERLRGYYQGREDAVRMVADLFVNADLG